jgi:hypothetical protein
LDFKNTTALCPIQSMVFRHPVSPAVVRTWLWILSTFAGSEDLQTFMQHPCRSCQVKWAGKDNLWRRSISPAGSCAVRDLELSFVNSSTTVVPGGWAKFSLSWLERARHAIKSIYRASKVPVPAEPLSWNSNLSVLPPGLAGPSLRWESCCVSVELEFDRWHRSTRTQSRDAVITSSVMAWW